MRELLIELQPGIEFMFWGIRTGLMMYFILIMVEKISQLGGNR